MLLAQIDAQAAAPLPHAGTGIVTIIQTRWPKQLKYTPQSGTSRGPDYRNRQYSFDIASVGAEPLRQLQDLCLHLCVLNSTAESLTELTHQLPEAFRKQLVHHYQYRADLLCHQSYSCFRHREYTRQTHLDYFQVFFRQPLVLKMREVGYYPIVAMAHPHTLLLVGSQDQLIELEEPPVGVDGDVCGSEAVSCHFLNQVYVQQVVSLVEIGQDVKASFHIFGISDPYELQDVDESHGRELELWAHGHRRSQKPHPITEILTTEVLIKDGHQNQIEILLKISRHIHNLNDSIPQNRNKLQAGFVVSQKGLDPV